MGFFGKKKDEEEKIPSQKQTSAKTILMLFVFLVGILLGGALEHYLIEPHFNNDLGGKLSECRGSLDLVNREVSNCYEQLEALQNQNPQNPPTPPASECVSDTDCSEGFLCYNSQFCGNTPDGPAPCEEQLGDLLCHKQCSTNANCPSEFPTCEEIDIISGNAILATNLCM